MSIRLAWANGAEGRLLSIGQNAVALVSTAPWPPGSRIEANVVGAGLSDGGEVPPVLKLKVHASRRRPEGDFFVEGRPIDLKRGLRERLEGLLSAPP